MKSLILRVATRYLAALLLIFSLYLLLRGHNEPGGGFIGGLVGATAFVLHAIACGTAEARAALRVQPQTIAVTGLAVALVAGLVPAFSGDAFLTGEWLFLFAEDGGKGIPLSTPLMFDTGVYLVVLGAILTLVLAMEEEI
ncbi:Na+/H+ antiporter subunit B [Oceaniglobus roseus]|uniref:Na+/H+ antiporter subunit B n=1 Tax=Oceaniglobus roseus TaxID=1737570 RepID=UPI000C7F4604|nr:Na+/H+ antiporter subunit B [Kandeliimicrobium roseum]